MIRDLEVLLLSITDATAREYMMEAVRCYHAGAYRAAVVVAMAAGMDDLRRKLDGLVSTKGASSTLASAVREINKRLANQDPFEQQAIDAAEQCAQLVTAAEAKELRTLLSQRHLCAHPSGHAGTAEEARHVIARIVDVVLARPGAFGIVGVEDIVTRLASPLFFPKPGLETTTETVAAELKRVHATLHQALISRLVDTVENELKASPSAVTGTRIAAVRFLQGMVALGGASAQAVWQSNRFGEIVHLGKDAYDVLIVVEADPSGLGVVEPLTRARALFLARLNLSQKRVRAVVRKLLAAGVLDESESEDLFHSAVSKFITAWSEETPDLVDEIGWQRLEDAFASALVERCGSGTFSESNPAIKAMQGLDAARVKAMADDLHVRYVLNVSSVGHGSYPARGAEALVKNGLGARTDVVDSFIRELGRAPEAVRKGRTHWETVGKVLLASNRPDAVVALLGAFVGQGREIPIELANRMAKEQDPAVADLGKRLADEWSRVFDG
jgi:hypothetical protein